MFQVLQTVQSNNWEQYSLVTVVKPFQKLYVLMKESIPMPVFWRAAALVTLAGHADDWLGSKGRFPIYGQNHDVNTFKTFNQPVVYIVVIEEYANSVP